MLNSPPPPPERKLATHVMFETFTVGSVVMKLATVVMKLATAKRIVALSPITRCYL